MKRRHLLNITFACCAAVLLTAKPARADDGVVVIANTTLRSIDADALKRIYSGRIVELDGQSLHPLQLTAGQPLRRRFSAAVLQQSDEDFIAYWTVRRYIGKGAPPRELGTTAEVIAHVQRTSGAIGYIDSSEVKPGMNVLLRR
jgi:ABC-type phosphate transport system substrate-binding protein